MPPSGPLIVQSDRTLLLDTSAEGADAARDAVLPFAELLRAPEHVHTFRLSRLSLWNAAARGLGPETVLERLDAHSRFPVPESIRAEVRDTMGRYGQLRLRPGGDGSLFLEADDPELLKRVHLYRAVADHVEGDAGPGRLWVREDRRGLLKQALTECGWPVRDMVGYTPGAPLDVALRDTTLGGAPLALRDYQAAAVEAFFRGGSVEGGEGVIVLPCGAGKTMVGLAAMATARTHTLVLVTGTVAARQWIREALDKTTLARGDAGEYSGQRKQIRPFTVATYQVVARRQGGRFPHLEALRAAGFGLVIYDEVHLLPAPLFRFAVEVQARRRLGLTATLVREDGRESDVFSLIGPRRYDAPWRDLEARGWVAAARCTEVRVPLPESALRAILEAERAKRFRMASTHPSKDAVIQEICGRHANDHVLVIGHFLDQLHRIAGRLRAPLITGETSTAERERLFREFRSAPRSCLVVSRVANFAVDLPEANVAVEISGLFGSRQEEAQRLGRILRPKPGGARFYAVVARGTEEQDHAWRRQLFLGEQGYRYEMEDLGGAVPGTEGGA